MSNTFNSVVVLSPCSKSRSSDGWIKFVGLNQSRGNFVARVSGCELCASVSLGLRYILPVFLENTLIVVVEATDTFR